jgi:hypothetical protein
MSENSKLTGWTEPNRPIYEIAEVEIIGLDSVF